MKYAFLFPGQGAQAVGMGKDWAAAFAIAKETFQEADDILGANLSKILFEGPADLLTKTQNSQPGLFIHSAAILRVLQQQMPELAPLFCSGLSLGEYSALFASGSLSFADTLRLIQVRAEGMSQACERTVGAMTAVIGMDAELVETTLKGHDGVWIANYNCPGQIVISGTQEGVRVATALLKEKGSGRLIPLQVHGAFHSPLMESAQDLLAPCMARAPIQRPTAMLVMNVPGDRVDSVEEIRRNLVLQVTHSVRWEQGIRAMMRDGVEQYIEIGSGRTLAGLNKKIGVGATLSLDKVTDLDTIYASATAQ